MEFSFFFCLLFTTTFSIKNLKLDLKKKNIGLKKIKHFIVLTANLWWENWPFIQGLTKHDYMQYASQSKIIEVKD